MENIQEHLRSMQKRCIVLHLDIMIEYAGKPQKKLENVEKLYKMLEHSRNMLANAGKHQKTQANVRKFLKMQENVRK